MGFQHSLTDSSLFTYHHGPDIAYLLLYDDDIVLTASSLTLLNSIIAQLNNELFMTDLRALNYFLGISVTRSSHDLFLSQRKYATEILQWANMLQCIPARTPAETTHKLGANGPPVADPSLYCSISGALQYLTFTRPDIAFAVQQNCLFLHDPWEPHLHAFKYILRYIRGTLDHGLKLHVSPTFDLCAYSDTN